jgi:C4-dicarboxylate-specific signal transduction histidine kinase
MAHELNQPLAAIMSNAEAVRLLLASERPNLQEAHAALREVILDDQRASDIIGRFRQLFRRRGLRTSTLSPGDLLDDVERIVRSRATIRRFP